MHSVQALIPIMEMIRSLNEDAYTSTLLYSSFIPAAALSLHMMI
jgi:hypothetical protein